MKRWALGMLLGLASGDALAGEREDARMLRQLDEREALQDSLESFFDSKLCAPLKRGRFAWPEEVAAPGVRLPVEGYVALQSCSVRALRFEPGPEGASVNLLFELDGLDKEGARRTVRGEAPATLRRMKGAWRLETLEGGWKAEVSRAEPRFTEQAEAAGLVLPPEADGAGLMDAMASGGVAVRDLNGDGLLDVLVVDQRSVYLFRATAPLRYERTRLAVKPPPGARFSSLAVGDFDRDGDPDVLATTQSERGADTPQRMLRNDGGNLVPVPTHLPAFSTHATAVSDLDGDGHLDVVLLHYPMGFGPGDFLNARDGRAPRFLLGKGDFTFREVKPPKAQQHARWGLAAAAADLLGEGRPQVYVANDFGDNDLWRLEPDGAPEDVTDAHGLRDPGNGMSVDVGDVDGDGRLDVYVANMFSKAGTRVLAAARVAPELKARLDKFAAGNTLYLGREGGQFEEVARARGVNRGLWAFGSIFLDAENDGRLDVAVANGYYSARDRKDL